MQVNDVIVDINGATLEPLSSTLVWHGLWI